MTEVKTDELVDNSFLESLTFLDEVWVEKLQNRGVQSETGCSKTFPRCFRHISWLIVCGIPPCLSLGQGHRHSPTHRKCEHPGGEMYRKEEEWERREWHAGFIEEKEAREEQREHEERYRKKREMEGVKGAPRYGARRGEMMRMLLCEGNHQECV